MNELMREEMAADCGMICCPMFAPNVYGYCDEDCDNCEVLNEFIKCLEKEQHENG